jgi:glucokinase
MNLKPNFPAPSLPGDIDGTHARFALVMGKGCFESYMQRIPTYVIRAEQSALIGCAMALDVQTARR